MIPNDPTDALEELFDSERGVSPVIGVILMVAITVILAAVIGTFVLGLGQDAATESPQATLEVSASSGNTITLEHKGGSALHADRTRVIVEASGSSSWSQTYSPTSGSDPVFSVGGTSTITTDASPGEISWGGTTAQTASGSETFSSGDSITVTLVDTESQRVIFETEVTAA